jgi:hypothetical protein
VAHIHYKDQTYNNKNMNKVVYDLNQFIFSFYNKHVKHKTSIVRISILPSYIIAI